VPQCFAAIGDKEVWLIEFATLNREVVISQEKGIAATGAVSRKEKFLAAKADRFGVFALDRSKRFLLRAKPCEIQRRLASILSFAQPIGALDGIEAGQEVAEFHGSVRYFLACRDLTAGRLVEVTESVTVLR